MSIQWTWEIPRYQNKTSVGKTCTPLFVGGGTGESMDLDRPLA